MDSYKVICVINMTINIILMLNKFAKKITKKKEKKSKNSSTKYTLYNKQNYTARISIFDFIFS